MKWLYTFLGVVVGGVTGCIVAYSAFNYFVGGSTLLLYLVTSLGIPLGIVLGAVAGIKGANRVWLHLSQELQNATKRAKVIYLSIVVITVVSINVISFDLGWHSHEMLSDDKLIANFERNRGTLNQLVGMVRTDNGIETTDNSWFLSAEEETAMKTERVAQYRKLLKSANVPRGLRHTNGRQGVKFDCWGIGSGLFSTKTKGYLYSEVPRASLLPTLDEIDLLEKKNIPIGYRRITDNWYVYYEHFTD